MDTCTPAFRALAEQAGGLDCDGGALVTLRNPLALQNASMPVIEFLLIGLAIGCLVHAVRWRRAHGDSSNLVIWLSSIVCLLLIEPIAYFPQWFGLEELMGLTFVHNQFSIQFLYDRMPLYIVAMYPVYAYLAYVLVQRTGILQRRNPFVAATCVAFIFHCLYQIVDTVGPQLRWWVWNQDLSTSVPALGSVPLVNMQAFTLGIPFGMVLTALWVCRPGSRSGVVRKVALVSLLVWPVQFVFAAPTFLLDLLGVPVVAARLIVIWSLVIGAGIITAVTYVREYRLRRSHPDRVPAGVRNDLFAAICVAVYLFVAVAIWITALPGYFAAVEGIAPGGGRTGSLSYALLALVFSIVLVVGSYVGTTVGGRKRSAT
ncbi:MAG: hypothetical protein PGN27_20975 [Mycolicibacterium neoaurum]|uniref:hypothetical protein n=1 Tax=Mycolicibacterium neoaurum TaxID=1795 RepID=UPI002FF76F53